MMWGGRAHVSAALSMSTLAAVRYNPVLQTFYDRLRRAGKAPKVALTACMLKVLAMRYCGRDVCGSTVEGV
jgi:transposase